MNNWMSRGACLVTLLLLMGCVANAKTYHPELRVKNPTAWVFPLPLAELRGKVLEAFSLDNQIRHPLPLMFTPPMMNTLSASTVEMGEKADTLWADFKDKNDIHLNDLRYILWQSMVYGGKQSTMSFVIHFEAAGEKETKVIVTAIDPKVIDGVACCGPHGIYSNYVSVAPTTYEEYTILQYLGKYLGSEMPRIIIPH